MAVVILSGAYVKAWFEEVFEVPVYNGMQMMVGDYLVSTYPCGFP